MRVQFWKLIPGDIIVPQIINFLNGKARENGSKLVLYKPCVHSIHNISVEVQTHGPHLYVS